MDEQLIYAYAVMRPTASLERQALLEVRGVADRPVRLVHHGELAAAVSSVPEPEYCEAALKVNLEHLDWLEGVARAHHSVVEVLSSHTTVLPLRLATVYLDDDRVRDVLRHAEAAFTAMLDRLADHVEWGVKVYVDVSGGSADTTAPDEALTEVPDPGRSYLRRRRQQQQARGAAWSAADDAVRRIEAAASELAVDHARHRPQQGQLAVGEGENVANDAYLVPRERSGEFRERVLRSAEGRPGVRVEITGPWAPYSFTAFAGPQAPEQVRQP